MTQAVQASPRTLFKDVNGRRFKVSIQGSGAPLLMLAGFSCDASVFDALAPLLALRWRIIRFDNRGVGGTTPRDEGDDYADLSIRSMAAHVLGHSMGGQIAQELAIHHPDQVSSLVLLSSWPKPDVRFSWLMQTFGAFADRLEPAEYSRMLMPWMFDAAAFQLSPTMMEGAVQQWAEAKNRPTPRLLKAQARAILESDTSDRLGLIRAPAIVGVAHADQLTPPELSAQLTSGIRGSRNFVAASGAHAFVLDGAEDIATQVRLFLPEIVRSE
jgi:pimeloyl-ACP methyl ester carboxylesterase